MKTSAKTIGASILVAAVVAAAVMVTGKVTAKPAPDLQPNSGAVVVRVNGYPIYLNELKSRVEGIVSMHAKNGSTLQQILGPDWQNQLLKSLETNAIVEAEAKRENVTVGPSDVLTSVLPIAQQFTSGSMYTQWMKKQGMTAGDMVRTVVFGTLASRVYLAVTNDAKVTDAEAYSYWKKHPYYGNGSTTPVSFMAVKDQIMQALLKQKRDQIWAQWLDQQLSQADVQVVTPDWWKEI
jgi:hypothetical protein